MYNLYTTGATKQRIMSIYQQRIGFSMFMRALTCCQNLFICLFVFVLWLLYIKVRVMLLVFDSTFNNISVISWVVVSFISGGDQSIQRRPSTCRKSLTSLSLNMVSSTPVHEQDSNSQLQYDHDHVSLALYQNRS